MKSISTIPGKAAANQSRRFEIGDGASRAPQTAATGPCPLCIQNILVPTDFSAASLKAIDYAAALAREFDGRIMLLHVVEPVVVAPEFSAYALLVDDEEVEAGALAHLKRIVAERDIEPHVLDRTVVRLGTPFHEITRAAEMLKADVIVIATHGHTGLKHVLLGSTAERVVRHARCPVFVVPARDRD